MSIYSIVSPSGSLRQAPVSMGGGSHRRSSRGADPPHFHHSALVAPPPPRRSSLRLLYKVNALLAPISEKCAVSALIMADDGMSMVPYGSSNLDVVL